MVFVISEFELDLSKEQVVSELIEEQIFIKEPGIIYSRNKDIASQKQGIDCRLKSQILFGTDEEIIVDEKAAIDYVVTDVKKNSLRTFAFELYYNNAEGWLFGEKYSKTQYYLISWLWADVDLKPNNQKYGIKNQLEKDKFTKIESYLISKEKLHKFLEKQFVTKENFMCYVDFIVNKSISKPFKEAQCNNTMSFFLAETDQSSFIGQINEKYGIPLKDEVFAHALDYPSCSTAFYKKEFDFLDLRIIYSPKLSEKPVNLLIDKRILRELAVKTWKIKI